MNYYFFKIKIFKFWYLDIESKVFMELNSHYDKILILYWIIINYIILKILLQINILAITKIMPLICIYYFNYKEKKNLLYDLNIFYYF